MNWVARTPFVFALIFSLVLGPIARADEGAESTQATFELVSKTAGAPAPKIETEYKEVDRSNVEVELANATKPSAEGATVIVTSDDDAVLSSAAKEKVFLIPFGRAIRKSADAARGLNTLLRNYPAYAVSAIKEDKLAFGITVIGLGHEAINWVHISSASTFAMTSNLMYSVLLSAIFLDQDLWSKATDPIQKRIRAKFKMAEVPSQDPTVADLTVKFVSNTLLATALNAGRASLIGIDQLVQQDFNLVRLGMPLLMGVGLTAFSFSWSELVRGIDKVQFPRAKKIVRFAKSSRAFALSLLVTTAMLQNPDVYGWRPWIILSISGTVGLVSFKYLRKLTPKIEAAAVEFEKIQDRANYHAANVILNGPEAIVNKVTSVKTKLKRVMSPSGRREPLTCEAIF